MSINLYIQQTSTKAHAYLNVNSMLFTLQNIHERAKKTDVYYNSNSLAPRIYSFHNLVANLWRSKFINTLPGTFVPTHEPYRKIFVLTHEPHRSHQPSHPPATTRRTTPLNSVPTHE
ncbi:hypothetical protein RND81_14G164500 [Saponaria officinalis]|uniref:Uncharacterized protein n=1 Tax=Saponaria officinalis TaxID=3572 RepID=A0AAW1GN64_SAPOF